MLSKLLMELFFLVVLPDTMAKLDDFLKNPGLFSVTFFFFFLFMSNANIFKSNFFIATTKDDGCG